MRRRFARHVGVLVAIAGALGARPALAADRPCSPMAVDADARVRSLWPAAAEHVREAFDARDDIDTCARVRLRIGAASDAAIVVEVILPDGRAASRAVARREDVVPTLEAAAPLLITAAVSIGAGFLAAQLFLRAQLHETLQAPALQYYLVITAGLVASIAVIASTLPLLNRLTGPEVARND